MSDTSIKNKLLEFSPNNKEFALFLLSLKERNDLFLRELEDLKMDFLLRGICEKEVDGLLEDPLLFPSTWLPEHLRWGSILHTNGERLIKSLTEANQYIHYSKHIDIDCHTAEKLIRFIDVNI